MNKKLVIVALGTLGILAVVLGAFYFSFGRFWHFDPVRVPVGYRQAYSAPQEDNGYMIIYSNAQKNSISVVEKKVPITELTNGWNVEKIINEKGEFYFATNKNGDGQMLVFQKYFVTIGIRAGGEFGNKESLLSLIK